MRYNANRKNWHNILRPSSAPGEALLQRAQRDYQILSAYLSDSTLAELGEKHRLSRERIRQVLRGMGVTYADSGRRRNMIFERDKRRALRAELRQRRLVRKYGASIEWITEFKRQHPNLHQQIFHNFSRFRINHLQQTPTIPFLLTFKDWWELWDLSGCYDQRGPGQYGLTRVDPTLGFQKTNLMVRHQSKLSTETRLRVTGRGAASNVDRARAEQRLADARALGVSVADIARMTRVDAHRLYKLTRISGRPRVVAQDVTCALLALSLDTLRKAA